MTTWTSCDNCGVVVDVQKVAARILKDAELPDGGLNPEAPLRWDGDSFVAVVACPVCGTQLT